MNPNSAPIRKALSIPVDVINVNSPSLRTYRGTVTGFDHGVYAIEFDNDRVSLDDGARVVLNLHRPAKRVTATIISCEGRRVTARERSAAPPDNRSYPRLIGGISLRYQVVGADIAATLLAWRDGEKMPGDAWHVPDPFMNFSVGGVRFHDDTAPEAGELLLCEFGVPQSTERWRAVGEVIRVLESGDDDEAAYSVAVQFVDLPDGAHDALTDYTLRLQRVGM